MEVLKPRAQAPALPVSSVQCNQSPKEWYRGSSSQRGLLVDQILLLALNFKPADYNPATPDVRRFLCAALQAMGRPSLTIDLAAYKL